MFNNKRILVTGGTGSFGKRFSQVILNKYKVKKLVIFSRDEMKQWNMANQFSKYKNIEYIIGDVRDKDSLNKALKSIDYVVHAAATKIVPTAEYNPFECIKTNINGATNVIDACIENKVKKVIALSTDKASNPINLYGATKLASDKLFISANLIDNKDKTKLSVVRYGNVMGSRGSIIPFFLSLNKPKYIPITDKNMTRFMISLEQAVDLVIFAFKDMVGGEIYVKKIPSMKIVDIAKTISPTSKLKIIGIRPGEKIHEQMIGLEDALSTYEYKDYYKILPTINNWHQDKKRIKNGKLVSKRFSYNSLENNKWMSTKQLKSNLHLIISRLDEEK
tara:strand:- start:2406 stop:3407 length:1002 start_codon:yes stop_codon:yes gene_type:complete